MREAPEELGRRVARGVAWVTVASVAGRLLTLLWLVLLARALMPEDFGLMASALAVLLYLETVADLGMNSALIRWPDRQRDAAQVAFVVGLAMAALWLLVVQLGAGSLSRFFDRPELAPVLATLAWVFPIRALGATHDALCQKELRFGARLLPELLLPFVKGGLAWFLAQRGLGVWSLVWGHLAGHLAWTLSLWLLVPLRPELRFSPKLGWPMWRFGRGIVAVNALAALLHHADLVVVGRWLGATALGFYQLAYKIPEMTLLLLARILSRVLFPAFSKIHHDPERLRRGYLAGLRSLALVAIPAAAVLALLSPPLITVAFGSRWSEAAPILRILALYFGVRCLGTHAGDVLKAKGRSGLLAGLGLVKVAILLPALALGVPHGATGVAWSMTATGTCASILNLGVLRPIIGLPFGRTLAALVPGIGCGAVVATGTALALTALGDTPPWLQLGGGLGTGAILWLSFTALLARDLISAHWPRRQPPAEGSLLRCGRWVLRPRDRHAQQLMIASWLVPRRLRERAGKALLRLVQGPRSGWGARQLELALGAELQSAKEIAPLSGRLIGLLESPELLAGTPIAGAGAGSWLIRESGPPDEREQGVVALLDRAGRPRGIVKARPAAAGTTPFDAELVTLRTLAATGATRDLGAPAWGQCRRLGGLDILVTAWVPGVAVYTEMQSSLLPRSQPGRHLLAAARWLARLHTATREDPPYRLSVDDLERQGSEGNRDSTDPWKQRLAAGFARQPVFRCRSHGDFWPGNLLVVPGSTIASGAVDWGRSRASAVPFDDLFHFPFSYAVAHPWSRWRRLPAPEALRRATRDRRYRHHLLTYFTTYAATTQIPLEILPAAWRWWVATGGLCRLGAKVHPSPALDEVASEIGRAMETLFARADAEILPTAHPRLEEGRA